jgi:hypothetical protein
MNGTPQVSNVPEPGALVLLAIVLLLLALRSLARCFGIGDWASQGGLT